MLVKATAASVRAQMRPGDIIAFSGDNFISKAIRLVTRCHISHIGILTCPARGRPAWEIQIAESTSLDGKPCVQNSEILDRVKGYGGDVYWLPLSMPLRQKMNICHFQEALSECNGRPYDFKQVAHFYFDRFNLWSQSEDPSRLFCSEFAAYALKCAGVLPVWFNSSEFRPSDLISIRIYGPNYYQLKGKDHWLSTFNSKPLDQWRN